jgi:phage host-nuclease inhibitor protein Gam
MSRIKPKIERLTSWEDADLLLAEIAELERQQSEVLAKMQQAIDDAKLEAKDAKEIAVAKIAEKVAQIQDYAESHRSELGDRKSKELTFGQLGWRSSKTLTLPRDPQKLADIIEQLIEKDMSDCVVKLTPTISKEKLREYEDDKIKALGITVTKKDAFWIETKREKITPEVS